MRLSGLERVLFALLLLMLVMAGMGACAAPSRAGGSDGDNYIAFEKALPSGKVVECIGWRYSGADGKGATLECFPK